MKISIITATRNSSNTISGAMSSIRSQTYPSVEHLIIDGLSTDDTIKKVSDQSNSNTVIVSELDSGIYDALNKGVKLASGHIVGFLHSDDFFPDASTLSDIAKVFRETKCDALYGDLEYVSRQNSKKVVRRWISGSASLKRIRCGWMPPHPTFYIKRELFEKSAFYTDYRISGDYEFMLRHLLGNNLKVEYIPRVIYKMRLGGASNKSIKNLCIKMFEDISIMKKYKLPLVRCLLGKNLSKIKQFFPNGLS